MLFHFSLSQAGLYFCIAGLLLSFHFGLPPKLQEDDDLMFLEEEEEKMQRIRAHNRARAGAFAGLTIVFIGFLLQFIGN